MNAVHAVRAPLLLMLVMVVSGCSVAGTAFRPGIAAVVGDRTVSMEHAAQVTDGYCEALTDNLEQQGQQIPKRYLSAEVVAKLTIKVAVEQVAEEYRVEPTDQYRSEISSLSQQVAGAYAAAADAYVEVGSAVPYYRDILTTVGGVELGDIDANSEKRFAAGQDVLTRWIAGHDVEFNPRYGLAIEDGLPVQTDTDTSYAFGDDAKAGQASAPDPDYAAELPGRLVCG